MIAGGNREQLGSGSAGASTGEYFDLKPTDDCPTVTVITHVTPVAADMIRVQGGASDNYDVKRALVNDRPVRATGENHGEWEIDLPFSGTDP